jgi:hypothetical protein
VAGARHEWEEINLVRGLAAVCMVYNHAGALLTKEAFGQGLAGQLVFLGSYAPVLFFFVTGLGYGVQRDRSGPLSVANWTKIGVLVAADQLLHNRLGRPVGLDFLAFIGLSSLLLEFVARRARAQLWAVAGAVLVLVLRYGLARDGMAARLGDWFTLPRIAIAGGQAGLAYPLGPWLVYPLLGFVAGRQARERLRDWPRTLPWLRLGAVLLTVAGVGATLWLTAHGRQMFRWGSMSLAFFTSTAAFTAVATWLCVELVRFDVARVLRGALSLRGVASLVVVPVHYVLIELCLWGLGGRSGGMAYLPLATLVLVGAFWLSGRLESALSSLGQRSGQGTLWWAAVALAAVCSAALLAGGHGVPAAAVALMALGQLALSSLLVLRR